MNPDIKLERVNGEIRGVAGMAVLKMDHPNLDAPIIAEVIVVAPDAGSLDDALRRLGTRPVAERNEIVRVGKDES